MTYVVQSECLKCKYGDCVEVCPVNCFYEGPNMLYINPSECIECDACVAECPVHAIVPGEKADQKWLQENAQFNFNEATRRTSIKEVTHGPNFDPMKQH